MRSYSELTATRAPAADIAAAGPTEILFSDGETFPAGWTPIDAEPDQFDGATYVAGDYGFAPEGDPGVVREAWLIGELGAAVHVFEPPLKVGAHEDADPFAEGVVIAPGAMTFV